MLNISLLAQLIIDFSNKCSGGACRFLEICSALYCLLCYKH